MTALAEIRGERGTKPIPKKGRMICSSEKKGTLKRLLSKESDQIREENRCARRGKKRFPQHLRRKGGGGKIFALL